MSRRINVRGIIWQDGQLLTVRHLAHTGEGKNFWCTPGGGLDDGESLVDGIKREIIEETGITPQIGRLLFIQQFKPHILNTRGFDEFLEFFYHITNAEDFQTIDLASSSHGAAEIAEWAWRDPTDGDLLPKFLSEINFTDYTTNDKPVLCI